MTNNQKKLSPAKAKIIRQVRKAGFKVKHVAWHFKVSVYTIYAIRSGRYYKGAI